MPPKVVRMPKMPPVPMPPVAPDKGDNLTEAVERIANKEGPLTKKALKEKLSKEGFPDDRLANYFYTTIHRLKAKNKIYVGEDGSVGPAF
jgi:hypothetical protein